MCSHHGFCSPFVAEGTRSNAASSNLLGRCSRATIWPGVTGCTRWSKKTGSLRWWGAIPRMIPKWGMWLVGPLQDIPNTVRIEMKKKTPSWDFMGCSLSVTSSGEVVWPIPVPHSSLAPLPPAVWRCGHGPHGMHCARQSNHPAENAQRHPLRARVAAAPSSHWPSGSSPTKCLIYRCCTY